MPPGWIVVERLGHLGASRDARYKEWTKSYGPKRDYRSGHLDSGGWDIVWVWENGILAPKPIACGIYEQAYFAYSKSHDRRWRRLARRARDIYDKDRLNDPRSGLDYQIQRSPADHIQDIAIRRVFARAGFVWLGKKLIRIRRHESRRMRRARDGEDLDYGYHFSPGKVPFHRPNLILEPHLEGWWDRNTVEDWYQSNRVLVVKSTRSQI